MRHEPLLLINSLVFDSNVVRAECVMVDPVRSIDLEPWYWDAWTSGANRQYVWCRGPGVYELVSYFAEDERARVVESVYSAARNSVEIELEGLNGRLFFLPHFDAPDNVMFISQDRDLKPSVSDVTIELRVDSLLDLPDVMAYGEYLKRLGSRHGRDWERSKAGIYMDAAATKNVQAGQILPIEVRGEDRAVYGAIILREQLSARSFSARILLSEESPTINVGTLLHRHVHWEEDGTTRHSEAVIAEVMAL